DYGSAILERNVGFLAALHRYGEVAAVHLLECTAHPGRGLFRTSTYASGDARSYHECNCRKSYLGRHVFLPFLAHCTGALWNTRCCRPSAHNPLITAAYTGPPRY